MYAISVSIKHMLCNYKQFQENKLDCPFWGNERVTGNSYNIVGLRLTSCCGGLVLSRPRTGIGPGPLCWYCGLVL